MWNENFGVFVEREKSFNPELSSTFRYPETSFIVNSSPTAAEAPADPQQTTQLSLSPKKTTNKKKKRTKKSPKNDEKK